MSTIGRLRERVVGMRTCHDVGRVLQSYLDDELDPARVKKVAAHLEQCRRCGMEADTYARIKESLARVARDGLVHPEDQLSIERLRRFADTL
jgi:anti-sigma factor RsiW